MMFNFSRQGMYIETDVDCLPGEDIDIVVEDPPYASGPCLHRAEIMWSKELFDPVVFYRFSAGAKFDLTINYSLDRSNLPVKKRSGEDRRSGRDRRNGHRTRRKWGPMKGPI